MAVGRHNLTAGTMLPSVAGMGPPHLALRWNPRADLNARRGSLQIVAPLACMGTPCRAFDPSPAAISASTSPSSYGCRFECQIVMSLLRWSLACFIAIYILMIVGLAVFQRRFQYFPDRHLADPARAGMSGVEDLRLTANDGETLVAWYVPAKNGHPLILYFHGNGGAVADRVPLCRSLLASGYGLLSISYRGYGGSTGSPTQKGLMEDAETAYLEARARGYDGDRIVLMGESLGPGVAIALAATHEAAALVLDSPYLSAVAVAAAHYRVFPVRWLMIDRFRADFAICGVHIPVLIVHGDEDGIIPINSAKRLFELANEPKIFMSVSGGGHLVLGSAEVFPPVREWIGTAIKVKRPSSGGRA